MVKQVCYQLGVEKSTSFFYFCKMKFLILILMLTSCATTSEYDWKMKKMHKEGKQMFKKVQRARKYGRK
jgi:hypothetical protein